MDPKQFPYYQSPHVQDPYCFMSQAQDQENEQPRGNQLLYARYPKPPYSYQGLAIMAIQLSPRKSLPLAEIYTSVGEMFPFFRSSYTGWKASLRHTLTKYDCFIREESNSSAGVWTVDLSKVPPTAFRRQETAIARLGNYAYELHTQLGVPRVSLPTETKNMPTSKFDSSSDSSSVMSPEICVDDSPLAETTKVQPLIIDTTPSTTNSDQPRPWLSNTSTTMPQQPLVEPLEIASSSKDAKNSCLNQSSFWTLPDTSPSLNAFYQGSDQNVSSSSMPNLSPIWSSSQVKRNSCNDNSFSDYDMPNLSPVWKILERSLSAESACDESSIRLPSFDLPESHPSVPLSTSTPALTKKTMSTLRLPSMTELQIPDKNFLIENILGNCFREGPEEQTCVQPQTSPMTSSDLPSCAYKPTVSTDIPSSTASQIPIQQQGQQQEVPPSQQVTEDCKQPHELKERETTATEAKQFPACKFQKPDSAPSNARATKSRKRKTTTVPKKTSKARKTSQSSVYTTAIENLQRIGQNFTHNYATSPSPVGQLYPTANASQGQLYPTAQSSQGQLYPPSQSSQSQLYPAAQSLHSQLYPPSQSSQSQLYLPSQSSQSQLYPAAQSSHGQLYPAAQSSHGQLYPAAQSSPFYCFQQQAFAYQSYDCAMAYYNTQPYAYQQMYPYMQVTQDTSTQYQFPTQQSYHGYQPYHHNSATPYTQQPDSEPVDLSRPSWNSAASNQ